MTTSHRPQNQIAAAYQIHPSTICRLKERHGLTTAQLADPEIVFEKLLESSRKSPLREKLSSPVFRGLVAEHLDLQAIRGTIPTAAEKISSII